MRFFYTRDYHPYTRSPREYISRGIINVVEDNQMGIGQTIGRVGMDMIDYTRIFKEGMVSLYDVCDTYSGGWPYLYSLIFDSETGEILKEITQLGTFDFLVLINRMELLPPARLAEASILYHLAHINGCATLSCISRHITDLNSTQLSEIGFCKIANSDLLLLNTSIPIKNFGFVDDVISPELDPNINYSAEIEKLWAREL